MKLAFAFLILAAPLAAQGVSQNDTLHIPLSPFQQTQLLELKQQADKIQEQQAIILQTIIAGKKDPRTIQGWTLAFTDTSLVLIPPAKVAAVDTSKKAKGPNEGRK